MRRNSLFITILALMAASIALAEVSVVIGYDTRAEGEIDPCG